MKLCGGIGQGHARPAFDVAAKWPVLALYDKQDAVAVEIAVEVCVVVDAGGHGPTALCCFRLCSCGPGKERASKQQKEHKQGRLKILDVAMMQPAPGFQDGSCEANSAFPYLHPVLINVS